MGIAGELTGGGLAFAKLDNPIAGGAVGVIIGGAGTLDVFGGADTIGGSDLLGAGEYTPVPMPLGDAEPAGRMMGTAGGVSEIPWSID